VEELGERIDLPAFADLERTCDAQVRLYIRCASEFVEAGVHAVHKNASAVIRRRDRDGARALDLSDGAQFKTAGDVYCSGEPKAMANVFAGRTVIAGSEGIQLSSVR